jgi:succinyl-CoA synthetase beta subunit
VTTLYIAKKMKLEHVDWLLSVSRFAGKPVNTLYIAKKMKLKREMYFAILLDRKTSGPIMIGCR